MLHQLSFNFHRILVCFHSGYFYIWSESLLGSICMGLVLKYSFNHSISFAWSILVHLYFKQLLICITILLPFCCLEIISVALFLFFYSIPLCFFFSSLLCLDSFLFCLYVSSIDFCLVVAMKFIYKYRIHTHTYIYIHTIYIYDCFKLLIS